MQMQISYPLCLLFPVDCGQPQHDLLETKRWPLVAAQGSRALQCCGRTLLRVGLVRPLLAVDVLRIAGGARIRERAGARGLEAVNRQQDLLRRSRSHLWSRGALRNNLAVASSRRPICRDPPVLL